MTITELLAWITPALVAGHIAFQVIRFVFGIIVTLIMLPQGYSWKEINEITT